MSKRHRGGDSSLELLLDTICNTFGGILFVALLIVIMLRMTSKAEVEGQDAQVSEAEQLELEQQQLELQASLETLRQATASLDESADAADSADSQLLEEFKNRQRSRQELLQDRLKTLDGIAAHQASVNQAERELDQLDKRQQSATSERQALESKLKLEVEARSQQIEYSRTHHTGKLEISTVVRYGRFYVWHRHGATGRPLGLNTDDFIVLEDTDSRTRTTPMPHGGTAIAGTPEASSQLVARLDEFNPKRDYIGLVVWPDSFEQFGVLKKVLIQKGFEYRLIPAKDGDKFTDRGGSRDGVQ